MFRLLKKSRSILIITTKIIKAIEEAEEDVAVEVEIEAVGHMWQSMSIRKDSISRIQRS